MIESEDFFAALHVLSEVLPFQKQLSAETRNALWQLFPPEAKRDLTPADLQWAVAQRLIDPDPPRDTAISSVLIHYLYPKRDGWPAFDAGPRRLDPRTAVRDERKVFRAEDVLSQPRSLSAGEFAALYTQQVEPDAGVSRKISQTAMDVATLHAQRQQAQDPLPTALPAMRIIEQAGKDIATLSARTQQALAKSTPMHNGGEGPDGMTPPIWTDPNWMGGSRGGDRG